MLLRLTLLFVIFASGLQAGAWPRTAGTGFVSTSARVSWPRDSGFAEPPATYLTLYGEWGLNDRVTLGFDLGHSVSGDSKTIGFVRLPVPLPLPDGWVAAADLGLGQISGVAVARPTLSVGRGVAGAHGGGWLNLDLTVEYGLTAGATDVKLDATWGMTLPRNRKLILQVQSGQPQDQDMFLRLAPSVVFPVRGALQAELGATIGLTGDTNLGVLIGLWRNF